MRKGHHKLIYFYGDGVADGEGDDPRVELYDLSLDLSEQHDLASIQPARCIEMRDELLAWLREVGAGIPIVKATGEPAVFPKKGRPFAIDWIPEAGNDSWVCCPRK